MKVQSRILTLVFTVLLSMALIAAISLSVLRSNMMSERQNQLATLVELGKASVAYFQKMEADGTLSKEEAQQRAKQAIAAEAARAGEQGHGFAVVADEVRKLAERTARATDGINLTIRGVLADTEQAASHMDGVRHQVRNSVARAELAATSLREIRDRVGAVLDKTRDVARAAQEQSLASNSIAGNVEQIAQRVDESNAAVEQLTSSPA